MSKVWACPSCDTEITVETLRAPTVVTEGQWVVSGVCPDCQYGVRITKHGIVITTRMPAVDTGRPSWERP